MTLVLDATVGSATANSYNTLVELNAAADEAYPEPLAWSQAAGEDIQLRAAVEAAKQLDQERFPETRVDDIQLREWPRAWVPKEENYLRGTDPATSIGYWSTDEIPTPIKTAHALLTFYLVAAAAKGTNPLAASEDAGLASISYGSESSMTFESGATSVTAGERFMRQTIRPLLAQHRLVYARQARALR